MLTILNCLLLQAVAASPTATPTAAPDPVLRALAERGANVLVLEDEERRVSVSFPFGELRRRWRKEHDFPMPLCGMGVALEVEPPDTGPPMTDLDIPLLERVPALFYVDLSGTPVTPAAVRALRKRRPQVTVVWEAKRP